MVSFSEICSTRTDMQSLCPPQQPSSRGMTSVVLPEQAQVITPTPPDQKRVIISVVAAIAMVARCFIPDAKVRNVGDMAKFILQNTVNQHGMFPEEGRAKTAQKPD